MQNELKKRVLVIGTGNIAQGYDEIESKNILTHIKAYKKNNNFDVTHVFDINIDKALDVAKKWNIKNTLEKLDLSLNKKFDVISICTPDNTHIEMLSKCLELEPKLVFCEKPISLNFSESEKIVELYSKKNITLVVNYSRRWINKIVLLKDKIKSKNFGKILSVRIKYYGGFIHNGSHLIDLINFFLSPKVKNSFISLKSKYKEDDDTISFLCDMNCSLGSFTLIAEAYNGEKINPLELEFIFEKYKIIIEESKGCKISIYDIIEDINYKGYYEFHKSKRYSINPSETILNSIKNINDFLDKKTSIIYSTGITSVETLKICSDIIKSGKYNNV